MNCKRTLSHISIVGRTNVCIHNRWVKDCMLVMKFMYSCVHYDLYVSINRCLRFPYRGYYGFCFQFIVERRVLAASGHVSLAGTSRSVHYLIWVWSYISVRKICSCCNLFCCFLGVFYLLLFIYWLFYFVYRLYRWRQTWIGELKSKMAGTGEFNIN